MPYWAQFVSAEFFAAKFLSCFSLFTQCFLFVILRMCRRKLLLWNEYTKGFTVEWVTAKSARPDSSTWECSSTPNEQKTNHGSQHILNSKITLPRIFVTRCRDCRSTWFVEGLFSSCLRIQRWMKIFPKKYRVINIGMKYISVKRVILWARGNSLCGSVFQQISCSVWSVLNS